MKKIISVVVIVIMSIASIVGLVGCTPFTVDKYLEEVAEGTNLTMEYEWNLMGAVTRDIYQFDEGNMRRLGSFEMVTSLNSDGEYDTYNYIYNVWFKDRTVNKETYLNAIGFGENGGGFGDEFSGTPKQEGIEYASNALQLARENLDESYEMDTDKFVLKEEFYADVFGIKFDNYGNVIVSISLDNGEIELNMVYGSYSFVLTISDLGSTKVKITDEMKNADEKFVVYV